MIATPSNAVSSDVTPSDAVVSDGSYYYDIEEMDDHDLLGYILEEVAALRASMFGPASDDSGSQEAPALEDPEADLYDAGTLEDVFAYAPLSLSADVETSYVNALRFDCVIDGDDAVVIFSSDHVDKLFIDENNRLWNMSASTVQGRIVDSTFDPYADAGDLVYLSPCLGNNFSTISNYGSPNYVRSYYWSGGRLAYTDTYTEIVVEDYHYPYFVSDTWNYIFLFILLGGVLILWLKNYRRY